MPSKRTVFCSAVAQSKQEKSALYHPIQPEWTQKALAPLSPSREDATRSTKPMLSAHAGDVPPLDHVQVITLHALDYAPGNFRQHFDALWEGFKSKYERTDNWWPSGCSQLMRHNKTLDLALIALSARRLAFSQGEDQRLTLLSLTAYDKALNSFIALLQQQDELRRSSAILAVTSTVFSLLEGSQMQREDIVEYGWRWSKHLNGALELVRKSGPEVFSVGGFHPVFKKIREMGVRWFFPDPINLFLGLTAKREVIASFGNSSAPEIVPCDVSMDGKTVALANQDMAG